MSLVMKQILVEFDRTKGMVQKETRTVHFDTAVRNPQLATGAFKFKYSNKDHHVWEQRIEFTKIGYPDDKDDEVTFDIEFLLRDSSGNINDLYEGFVNVLVFAESTE